MSTPATVARPEVGGRPQRTGRTGEPDRTLTDVRHRRLSPERYRSVSIAALVLLVVIVVSGAAVRLTGSGLGCDDWPRCNDEKLVDVSSAHAAIEQVNRLFTGLVAFVVIAAVLGALIRDPRRRDLTWLSCGLVAGVLAQIVLGGVTVLVDLHPAAVQAHLLLSMVLVADAVVLVHYAGLPDGERRIAVGPTIRPHLWVVAGLSFLVIVLGTVVTGAGPHAGDETARRFDVDIARAAQLHGVAVWVAVAAVVALMWRVRGRPADREMLDRPLTTWVAVAVVQGGIGYLQYFSGIPPLLVGFHVLGATMMWAATVWMLVAAVAAATAPPELSAGEALDELGGLADHR